MTDQGRAAMALLLLCTTALAIARAAAPRPRPSDEAPAAACAIPVEESDGIHCLAPDEAARRDLHPGDAILAGGGKGRLSPARIDLFQLPIDLNRASPEELASLPGIGAGMARRIIEGRPFPSLSALRALPGIGPKKWAQLKDRLYVAR